MYLVTASLRHRFILIPLMISVYRIIHMFPYLQLILGLAIDSHQLGLEDYTREMLANVLSTHTLQYQIEI